LEFSHYQSHLKLAFITGLSFFANFSRQLTLVKINLFAFQQWQKTRGTII